MPICYELKELDEASQKNTTSNLVRITAEEALKSTVPTVIVCTREEFETFTFKQKDICENVKALMLSDVNFVDIYSDYIVGSFAVPDKAHLANDPDMFAFYMDKTSLIFVDEGSTAADILAGMANSGIIRDASTAHCLYVFFRELLINDLVYLGKLEDSMETFEEDMLRTTTNINPGAIMQFRRKAMQLGLYYQQIATMASLLEDDENDMMTHGESHAFTHIANLTDRLTMRTDTLKEYGVQLYELQQAHIDMRQNTIMQIFTIITVLFAPLTLITGWFGMNLNVLPGTTWDGMWLALIILAVVCTGTLLFFFYRRKWL